jgi:hypothetical protein
MDQSKVFRIEPFTNELGPSEPEAFEILDEGFTPEVGGVARSAPRARRGAARRISPRPTRPVVASPYRPRPRRPRPPFGGSYALPLVAQPFGATPTSWGGNGSSGSDPDQLRCVQECMNRDPGQSPQSAPVGEPPDAPAVASTNAPDGDDAPVSGEFDFIPSRKSQCACGDFQSTPSVFPFERFGAAFSTAPPLADAEESDFEWEAFENEVEDTEGGRVAELIRRGLRDENQLSNGLFERRHPERVGKPILSTERALVAEWRDIRARVVRPALRAMKRVRDYEKLLPLLNRYRGDVPLEFLLGWIAVESGGRIGTTTSLDERGYFQVHPDESRTLGFDHQRLSTDASYSVQKGIALARHRAAAAATGFGVPPGSELAWAGSKLLHWLPLGVRHILALMKRQQFRPTTWAELRSFILDNRAALLSQLKARAGTGWDPKVGVANVDKVLRRGREIVTALGVTAPVEHEAGLEFEAEFIV